MGEYIRNIILAGVVCSVFSALTPSGENKSGRYVRYMACIITLIVIASPLSKFSSAIGRIKSYADTEEPTQVVAEARPDSVIIEKSAENISRSIVDICEDRFGIDKNNVKIKLILNEEDKENVIIEEIQLFAGETNKNLRMKIETYFADLFGCRVFVLGE